MAKEIKVKSVAKYNGHSFKQNKAVDLSVRFEYSELPNYVKLIQLLNENIIIKVKQSDKPVKKLGTFMLKEIKIDHDGEGIVKFNSMLDYVEADEINALVGDGLFKIMFEAQTEAVGDDDENS